MDEDYDIVEHFSPFAAPLLGQADHTLIEFECGPFESPLFGMGMGIDGAHDQILSLPYDGLPIDDTCARPLFDLQSESGRLESGRLDLIAPLDAQRDGGSADPAKSLKRRVESDETTISSKECFGKAKVDSAVSISTLGSPPRRPSVRSLQCIKCGETFDSGYLLEDHAIRENHYTFLCEVPGCDKSYRRRDVLWRHAATHGRPDFICQYCSDSDRKKIFKRKDRLSQHIRTRHPEQHPRYKNSASDLSPAKQLMTIPETAAFANGAAFNENFECGRLSPQRSSPCRWSTDTSMIGRSQYTTTKEIASALDYFLGGEDHIVVQIFRGDLDVSNRQKMEQLALSLARLALKEPDDIPHAARVQLEQTSAKCVLE